MLMFSHILIQNTDRLYTQQKMYQFLNRCIFLSLEHTIVILTLWYKDDGFCFCLVEMICKKKPLYFKTFFLCSTLRSLSVVVFLL